MRLLLARCCCVAADLAACCCSCKLRDAQLLEMLLQGCNESAVATSCCSSFASSCGS
jgi:hypothetical protein